MVDFVDLIDCIKGVEYLVVLCGDFGLENCEVGDYCMRLFNVGWSFFDVVD